MITAILDDKILYSNKEMIENGVTRGRRAGTAERGGARGPGNSAWPGVLRLGYRPDMPGIVIVGAGFGGIGMGIALKKAGYHDFVILDKAHDLGTGS